MALRDYLGEQRLGILAAYRPTGIVHYVGVVYPTRDNRLRIFIPSGHCADGAHCLRAGALVTVHLDNRTGVDQFDAELRVYRASYKGRVVAAEDNWLTLAPVEFVLIHGVEVVEAHREPGYAFPDDARPARALPPSPLAHLGALEERDRDNKIGVLTTFAQGQPHTTVLAFLSTADDDVFVISVPDTFKLRVLEREPRCMFTIDERAKFTFEESIDWNYTILETRAHAVPAASPLYEEVRQAFILKNPWEVGFFTIPGLTMLHLPRGRVVAAGEPRPLPAELTVGR
jgi:hypothetical protein